jgi:hypothetical protein
MMSEIIALLAVAGKVKEKITVAPAKKALEAILRISHFKACGKSANFVSFTTVESISGIYSDRMFKTI